MMSKPFLSTLLLGALLPGALLAQTAPAAAPPAATSLTAQALPAATPAPTAVTPQAVTPQAAPPSLAVPVMPADSDATVDPLGSTAVREVAKLQALTDLEAARAKLDAARFSRLIAQQKFTEQMSEAKAKSDQAAAASTKDEAGAVAGAGASAGVGAGAGAPVDAIEPVEAKPYATSYYNFNGKQFARITIDGNPTVVSPGDTLPDGTRVLSIDAKKVVLRRHGARLNVPYLGGGLGFGN